jgi:hypothetical protein
MNDYEVGRIVYENANRDWTIQYQALADKRSKDLQRIASLEEENNELKRRLKNWRYGKFVQSKGSFPTKTPGISTLHFHIVVDSDVFEKELHE